MSELKHEVFGSSLGKAMPSREEPKEEVMPENDLKSLIELGCIKDTVKIGDVKFGMRSLNITERISLMKTLPADAAELDMFDFNKRLLAMSIETVNGKRFESLHPGSFEDSTVDPIEVKLEMVANLQSPVLNKLLDFYQTIVDRCDAQFTDEQVKN